MRSYYIENESSMVQYKALTRYLAANSESFSVTYFKHSRIERLKKSTRQMKKNLNPYKQFARITNHLPSMETRSRFGHIYELVLYRSCEEVIPFLDEVGSLWAWDYPQYPMDLCFFKEGYAWFVTIAHESYGILYTENETEVTKLRELGLVLTLRDSFNVDKLYRIIT